jgi:hypothetical protein
MSPQAAAETALNWSATVSVHDLTDNEKTALGAIAEGLVNDHWDDQFARGGKVFDPVLSLSRFGLIKSEYDPGGRQDDGSWKVGRYVWALTDVGRAIYEYLHTRIRVHQCCEAAVVLPCVCVQRIGCFQHGYRCTGSHD